MWSYVTRRILNSIPTIFIVATIVFFVMRSVAGDPAMAVLGEQASQAALDSLRLKMHLNDPLFQQYIHFIKGIFTGNLGTSLINNQPIAPMIMRALPFTLELATWGVFWGMLLGIPLGFVSAIKRNTITDFSARIFSLVGLSTPSFYLGILLLLLFSVQLGWFPVIGDITGGGFLTRIYYVTLPAIGLGLELAAFVSRSTRSTVLEIIGEDYVRTAYAKGLSYKSVMTKHVLRNALISILTVTGVYLGVLLGGSILTETIFSRPGLGKFLVGAIQQRDYPAIEAGLLVYSCIIVLVNLIVDLSYSVIDPRISYK